MLLNFDADYAAHVRSQSSQNRSVAPDSPYGHVGMTDALQRENDAITLSLDDYIVTVYTRPSGFDTISTYVFNATIRGNAHTAETLSSFWALTTIIFLVILIIVIAANLAGRRKKEAVK